MRFPVVIAALAVACGIGSGCRPNLSSPTQFGQESTVRIVLDPDTVHVIAGAQLRVIALALSAERQILPNAAFRFESRAPSIFSVSPGGVVTGVAEGRGVLLVESGASRESAEVFVARPHPTVQLNQRALRLGYADSALVVVQASDGLGGPGTLRYASSDASVFTVSPSGRIRAAAPGRATLRVTNADAADSADVVVLDYMVALSADSLRLHVGEQDTARGVATVAGGGALTTPPPDFTSSDTTVFAVTPDGAITAVGPGTATLRVAFREALDSARVDILRGILGRGSVPLGGPSERIAVAGGRVVLTLPESGAIAVLPLSQPGPVILVPSGANPVDVALGADGRTAYVANGGARAIRVLDLEGGAAPRFFDLADEPARLQLAPGDSALYIGTTAGRVITLDPSTGVVRSSIQATAAAITAMAVAPSSGRLYVADAHGRVSALENTARPPAWARAVGDQLMDIAVSPDGAVLYVADAGSATRLLEAATGRLMQVAVALSRASGLVVTPDGDWVIASSAATGEVVVVDRRSLRTLDVFRVAGAPRRIALDLPFTSVVVTGATNDLVVFRR